MKVLDRIEEAFCGVALLTTALIVFVNVVLRYVFKSSTSWAEELVRYLMIWIAFVGGSICFRKAEHVSIDFFLDYLSGKGKKIIFIAVNLIALSFTSMMTIYGIKLVMFIAKNGQVSPALQLPMWIPYLAVPVGFCLMTIRIVQLLIKVITNKIKFSGKGINNKINTSEV